MAFHLRMSVGEALREIGRVLRDYWPSLVATVLVAGVAYALFAILRAHEDQSIEALLDQEGRLLTASTGHTLDQHVRDLLELARRWEGADHPDSAAWTRDVDALSERDPVYRAFEWRDGGFRKVWDFPAVERLPGGDLDSTRESFRANAASIVVAHPAGSVAGSFLGGHGDRELVFAAPLLDHGKRIGVLTAITHARDVIDQVVAPELKRGYSIAVREGPYRVYGAHAPTEGFAAIDWWTTAMLHEGELMWSVDFWPGPEMFDTLHSYGPPLVLFFGCILAVTIGSLVRVAQLVERARRGARHGFAAAAVASPLPPQE